MTLPDLDVVSVEDELVESLPVRVTRALAAEVWPEWFVGAPCGSADPDAWFPDATAPQQVLRTCQACPLRRPCLAVGILGDEHGIWGGTNRVQRTRARRRLNQGQPVAVVLAQLLDKGAASEPIRVAA
jgi:hypothetical protein